MSNPALVGVGRPTLQIRGTPYPVLLPSLRDARLHLAAVIMSLQVLGQVAFDFRLSIAQLLVAVLTCGVLEVAIAFRSQRVLMWPASALLTGNGVAFILRVPGTEHGDWWSMRGWWIFAGTAAAALLSKHLIRFRGRHVFNPSNFGLVICFLVLGPELADPLEFWWGPMSPWLVLALAIIVAGGLAILTRLRLLGIAVGFWLAFAGGIGVLAASGHAMTARWHLGPITGVDFWRVLVLSPEILVFLFFMITDPKTVPDGRVGRRVYAVGLALAAVLLIAPQTTEFATKVAVLGALTLVCAAHPLVELIRSSSAAPRIRRMLPEARLAVGALALTGAVGFVALLVLAGVPARPSAIAARAPVANAGALPEVTVTPSRGVASRIDPLAARQIARDVVADLRIEAEALKRRDPARATAGAAGARLQALWRQIRTAADGAIVVPVTDVERIRVGLEVGDGQGPPLVVAELAGTEELVTYSGSPPTVESRSGAARLERTLELGLSGGRYLIVAARGPTAGGDARARVAASGLAGIRLEDVAPQVGLDFRHGAFRYQVSADPVAMMGGGVCWLDYDDDGWLDLFAVNSYSEVDLERWETHGGLPRSALFHNVKGRFEDVSRDSGADLRLRGSGCVAADFNLDGNTDLYVTTGGYNVATDGYDALLWNNGDGTFTEGAQAAGINSFGWHAGAAVGDLDGDGRPDLFVAGYTDVNAPIRGSAAGFPTDHRGVRDRLYLNEGEDEKGHSRFREVGARAGLEAGRSDHGLGALLTDFNGDGRLDLYVANDADPNRLYENVPWPGGAKADPAGLGFRLEERGRIEGVADPNAGMGIAAADYNADGRPDLVVTNSHGQLHAVYGSRRPEGREPSFADARSAFASAFDTSLAGWGVSWADLDLDGNSDLLIANGAIPVTNLAKDKEPIQVLENLTSTGQVGQFADAGRVVGLEDGPRIVGRGLATADYDNDGDVDAAVNSIGGRLVLLESTGATGTWLEVKLSTFSPGAKVTAVLPDGRRLVREVYAGSSYLSSEDPRVHFGLGGATTVRELRVRYPSGRETRLTDVASNQTVVVGP